MTLRHVESSQHFERRRAVSLLLLVVVVVVAAACAACASDSKAPTPPRAPASPDATPIAAAPAATRVDNDPPEPIAPVSECNATSEPVYCQAGLPTRTAVGAQPFPWCHLQLAGSKATLGTTGRRFSAAETRKARASRPDACCYLEWTWTACR